MKTVTKTMFVLALGTMVPGAALAQLVHEDSAPGAHEGHGAHDMHTPAQPVQAAPAAAAGPVLYLPEDLQFLHHMIVHHQQAVDMEALMQGRTERADLIRFAGLIAGAQRAEIDQMQAMLDVAAARGLSAPEHMMHGDPPMAGMLSTAEMAALEAATGAEFERLWLEGMIFHHEGGLAMGRAQELQQALHRRQPYGIAVMLDEILIVQRSEVTQMHAWLDEWGLARSGDHHAPATDISIPAPDAVLPAGQSAALFGTAVDDTGIAAVRVAVQDAGAGVWLHADGGWGERELLPATLIGSGPASAAWRFDFTPPAAGRYAVEAEVEDAAGNLAASLEPRAFEAAP